MFPTFVVIATLACLLKRANAVTPYACHAKFRTDDCGMKPTPVMYYWKSGSRCEVGYWRGCLPNLNMFVDEYECVSTCIFSARAAPSDYHSLNAIDDYGLDDIPIPEDDNLTGNGSGNGTEGNETNEGGDEDGGNGTDGGGDDNGDNGGSEPEDTNDTSLNGTSNTTEAPTDSPLRR